MYLRTFRKLYQDLTVSLPPEKICSVRSLQYAGFFDLCCVSLLEKLEAPADFTTLVLYIK